MKSVAIEESVRGNIRRMWMKFRAWWYLRGKPEDIPRDVREYTIRRYLKVVVEGSKTLEEKRKLSTDLVAAALSLRADQIGHELRDELIATSFRVLDGVPLGKCAKCTLAVFIHEAIKIEDKIYCKTCAASLSS